jgi:UDP-glucose 4-epimerase
MNILLTGGAGYIGSHTALALLARGHQLVLVDNFSNSQSEVLNRLSNLSQGMPGSFAFTELDICDADALAAVFAKNAAAGQNFDAVIHFAGLKAVGESAREPLKYYQHNVAGTVTLLNVMQQYQVNCLVFSSSATVYGDPQSLPLTEQSPTGPQSVYGRSKLMVEQILADYNAANPAFSAVVLRYFNPVGAHPSGQLGEDPQGIPNNLLPFISQVAVGRREALTVFGNDYPTPDGTGVRDYIHVLDLADGHVRALEQLHDQPGQHLFNLGTGQGYSVLQMVEAFRQVSGQPIPLHFAPRRTGDVSACYADAGKAQQQLSWQAQLNLTDMVSDTWRWQQQNPQGYRTGGAVEEIADV